MSSLVLQEAPTSGTPGSGGRQELLSAARTMLDRKAAAVGKRGAHFPLLLNSSGVMVRAGGVRGGGAVGCICAKACLSKVWFGQEIELVHQVYDCTALTAN